LFLNDRVDAMPDDHRHYRTVATSPDGSSFVIAEHVSKEAARRIADGMRDQGWHHQFTAECENCADQSTGAPSSDLPA
jgi:hypothetical protein